MRKGVVLGLRLLAVLFLILAVATAVLWPISYRHSYLPLAFHLGIAVTRGGVYGIYNTEDVPFWPPALLDVEGDPGDPPIPVPHEWMGFGAGVVPGSGEGRARVPVPAAIVALLAAAAGSWTAARRVRRATPAGWCPACGYDLRATPDRCPECGAAPTARDRQAA